MELLRKTGGAKGVQRVGTVSGCDIRAVGKGTQKAARGERQAPD